MACRKISPWWGVLTSVPLFVSGTIAISRQGPPPLGGPLPGLSAGEQQQFNAGRQRFTQNMTQQDGLGPVFNGTSCAQCHRAGAIGGASPDLGVSVVTRIGSFFDGYSDLREFGGPLLQARSLREFVQGYPISGEVVPDNAHFISRRITTPLFGDGLIEAIPDETLIALAQVPRPDGIKGVAAMVLNPENGRIEVGRFGWKAQVSSLHWFSGDAFLNEMGITSPFFSRENRPQGRNIPQGADITPEPEDEGADVNAATNFMRLLAPPGGGGGGGAGLQIFNSINCSSCHVEILRTGSSPVAALANRDVRLWSDLLLHRMGPGLNDGVRQGAALGDQWRTAPLWGLGARRFYMHDGRATTIDQSIRQHGGEAAASTARYLQLTPAEQQSLIAFLGSL